MEKVSSTQFASSALWRFVDFISRKIVTLFISVLLARIILPGVYGVVALTMVFIVFCDIFILNGFNVALIRKKEIVPIDYSTVMTMSLIFTSVMYVIIWFCSPLFADFYESPDLCPVLRVITLLLFFESVSSVIRAKATREMQFKKMTIAAFTSSLASGLIALVMAYMGFGVWALVVQQVSSNLIEMVMLLIVFRWKISFNFSLGVAKSMTKFTIGVLGTSFLDFFGNNFTNLIVGKAYSTKDLGFMNRANILPETIGLNAYNSINSVLLPTLSSRQNSDEEMKTVLRKVMSLTMYVILPMMFGLIGTAKVLIPILLTEKWAPSIPLMYFLCLYYAVNPIRAIGYSAFYAKGQSKYSVHVEVLRSLLMVTGGLLVVFFKLNILFVLLSNLIVSLAVALTTQYKVRSLLNYTFSELWKDISPSLMMSLVMCAIVFLLGMAPWNQMVILFFQIVTGAVVYLVLSRATKNSNYVQAKGFLMEKFLKK